MNKIKKYIEIKMVFNRSCVYVYNFAVSDMVIGHTKDNLRLGNFILSGKTSVKKKEKKVCIS